MKNLILAFVVILLTGCLGNEADNNGSYDRYSIQEKQGYIFLLDKKDGVVWRMIRADSDDGKLWSVHWDVMDRYDDSYASLENQRLLEQYNQSLKDKKK
jgi:hypothetical protein